MARSRLSVVLVPCFAALLSACTTLPEVNPDRGDCQLRAGAAVAEGSVSGPFTTQAGGYGGAVTMIGKCPPDLRIVTRSQNGSIVCHGDDAWCAAALENQPLQVTPAQLRELVTEPPVE